MLFDGFSVTRALVAALLAIALCVCAHLIAHRDASGAKRRAAEEDRVPRAPMPDAEQLRDFCREYCIPCRKCISREDYMDAILGAMDAGAVEKEAAERDGAARR